MTSPKSFNTTAPEVTEAHRAAFRGPLLEWYESVKREMPWRNTEDPYHIWVAEVMLQQTRVEQVEPYYHRFLQTFPTVEALATAELDDVLRCWEGLGYYSRARHLHRAACNVVEDFGGALPDTYEAIRSLPGIGPYTAAAVLSIAFDKPYGVLDGNVIRVLSRVFEVKTDVTRARTRRQLQSLVDALLHPEQPASFNQALMELGATICTPITPECHTCPLQAVCGAHSAGTQTLYPIQKKARPVPHYDIAVGLITDKAGRLLIQKRPREAMLGGLWEFPGGKRKPSESLEDTCRRELQEELGIEVAVGPMFHRLKHAYSHFRITLHAFRCRIASGTPASPAGIPLRWVEIGELDQLAFPRANRRLIEQLLARRTEPLLFDGDLVDEAPPS